MINKTLIVFLFMILTQSSFALESATPEAGCYLGIFREGAPLNMGLINGLEKAINKRFSIIMWYMDWSSSFPKDLCDEVIKKGAVPHIVWEPWLWSDKEKIKLANILSGEWDEHIRSWAREIKKWGSPIFIRWGHEFNIEGYPWGIVNNGRDPLKYVMAYRHVHDIFKKEGAVNAKWVWCPMNQSWPPERWNDLHLAYPGDEYVDWIGIDGYNWGTVQEWSLWQNFKELFRDAARQLWRKHPSKPIMIAEFSSAEKGGDKGKWISEITGYLHKMPYIKAIIWFDHKKETDWRVKSSRKSFESFKNLTADSYYNISSQGLANITMGASAEAGKKTAYAMYAKKPILIDGNLEEWADAYPILLNDSKQIQEEKTIWKGIFDISGSINIKWDEQNIYIAGKIIDDFPFVNFKQRRNIWNGDAIEFTLSANPSALSTRESFGRSDYQIGLSAGNGREISPSTWIWGSGPAEGAQIAAVDSANPRGYNFEAKIPWSNFGKFVPSENEKIGFDFALDDADISDRDKQLVWNGDFLFYKDPGVWGELKFIK